IRLEPAVDVANPSGRARPLAGALRRLPARPRRGRDPAPARQSRAMSDSYAAAGVDIAEADAGVAALVAVLRTIDPGRASRSVLPSGHYASVLRLTDELGIALCCDGVGSKVVVAEQAGRYDTVGIDCVAMNVNDLVCVGAEPIALLDYLAVERA